MRGQLRIASARSPFQRAGLSWPTSAPVELHISELDGERLLRLIQEPVLTIQMSDDQGAFRALPALNEPPTVEMFQRMIDVFADDAPPVPVAPVAVDAAELERLTQVDAAWHADQRHLHDQGFQTLDALTSAWAADRVALNDKIAELETAQADAAKLCATIADLEARLAEATKPAAAKARAKPAE